MEFDIVPFIRVGPIHFGISRAEIRSLLGGRLEEFMKSRSSTEPTDDFRDLDLHVYYKNDCCSAVEVFKASKQTLLGHIEPTLLGYAIVGRPYSEVLGWMENLDPNIECDGTGLLSRQYGVSIFAPSAEDEIYDPVEGVYVFMKGVFGT